MTISKYEGYRPESTSANLDRVPASISPQDFYQLYVSKRKPCIITGLLQDQEFHLNRFFFTTTNMKNGYSTSSTSLSSNTIRRKGSSKKIKDGNNDTVLDRMISGIDGFAESIVKVEQRAADTSSFGTGELPKCEMTVGQLVDFLKQGREDLYLTTQYDDDASEIASDADQEDESESESGDSEQSETTGLNNNLSGVGRFDNGMSLQKIFPSPVSSLLELIPITPSILRPLVLQQINMWMGRSDNGTSSGLHHDFHDNLYILLQGRKRFTLFAPSDAPFMYTYGNIGLIHTNGLIAYIPESALDDSCLDGSTSCLDGPMLLGCSQMQLPRSDGADPLMVAKWRWDEAHLAVVEYKRMLKEWEREDAGMSRRKGKAKNLLHEMEAEVQNRREEFELLSGGMFSDGDDYDLSDDEEESVSDMLRIESEQFEEMMTGQVLFEVKSTGFEVETQQFVLSEDVLSNEEDDEEFEQDEEEENWESDEEDFGVDCLQPQSGSDSEIDWNAPDTFEELKSDDEHLNPMKEDPPSFSQVTVSALYDYLSKAGLPGYSSLETSATSPSEVDQESFGNQFPLLKYSTPISVELEAGEMLYLPASWFHEVTSTGLHVALNYWMHPPAALPDRVYEDDYWQQSLDRLVSTTPDEDDSTSDTDSEPSTVSSHISEQLNLKKKSKRL